MRKKSRKLKELLEKCTRGLTQNANESFHSKIWMRVRKIKNDGIKRVTFVAKATVLDHNFGYQKANLLKSLGISSLALEHSLLVQEKSRVTGSIIKKISKKALKNVKKDPHYNPGGF